eukprot:CAMPEP_0119373412 /NCGR_PEP_ID=MMETSP1334-20130426/25628_1 /TAXON_ID=127549 /ORGANISM="Calcidiscus leptoporus, Strain RCC1130" /LENGTH=330 /DNA_ID=CAMNT_0007391185 /DNA_START=40 /DNA_END=1032 /DNA_ORIENTATION=-
MSKRPATEPVQQEPRLPPRLRESEMPLTPLRLVDCDDALALLADGHASARARVKGVLKNWDGEELYKQVEEKAVAFLRGIQIGDAFSVEMLHAAVPDLNRLHMSSVAELVSQIERHLRYEEASAQLVAATRETLTRRHASECARIQEVYKASKEMAATRASKEVERVQGEAAAQIRRLNEQLEESQRAAQQQLDESERAAQQREDEQAQQMRVLALRLAEAQEETELKRETSRTLKAEVIENDKLTVATLGKIKALEAELRELRREKEARRPEHQEEAAAALRQMLQREEMARSLAHRPALDTKPALTRPSESSFFKRLGLPTPSLRLLE